MPQGENFLAPLFKIGQVTLRIRPLAFKILEKIK